MIAFVNTSERAEAGADTVEIIQIEQGAGYAYANQIAAIHSGAYSHGHFSSSFPAAKMA